MLEEKLTNGEIEPNSRPVDVYNQFPDFHAFDLNKFRSALNRTKADLGLHLRRKSTGNLLILIFFILYLNYYL